MCIKLSSPFSFRKNDFILVDYGSKYYDKNHQRNAHGTVHGNEIHANKFAIRNEQHKIPVDDFTTKWVDTYDVMAMLRVCRRTKVNYMKARNHTPTRMQKRNYFAINK